MFQPLYLEISVGGTRKTGVLKVPVMFSNFPGCQEKNPTQKIIDLTCRPNLLLTVPSQTSPKEHKSLETLRANRYKFRNFRLCLDKIKVKAMKD